MGRVGCGCTAGIATRPSLTPFALPWLALQRIGLAVAHPMVAIKLCVKESSAKRTRMELFPTPERRRQKEPSADRTRSG